MAVPDADVIIIGGGIAGLTCATGLCDQGLKVILLERNSLLGGRARSWIDPATGDAIDLGPHILLSEYANMLQLLERLGSREQITWQPDKFITLVDQPHPTVVRMHRLPPPFHFLPAQLAVPQVSWLDLATNIRVLWQTLRMNEADVLDLDQVNAYDHLRRMGVSPRSIDWFWRTASLAILNVPLEQCSAGALLRFVRFFMGRRHFSVGFSATGLAELFAPQVTRVIAEAGGQLYLNTEVAALKTSGQSVTGVQLSDGRELQARHYVAALSPFELAKLVPPSWTRSLRPFSDLSTFKPCPYISSYLWFDRKLTQEMFWAKVWSPDQLNCDFYDLSNIRRGWHARPSVVACNIIHNAAAEALSDDEIIRRTVKEIAAFAPAAAQARIRHSTVHRISMSIPAPHPGTERLRPAVHTAIKGFWLAGDWLNTGLPCSMESATRSGWQAADRILAAEGRHSQWALPPPTMQGLVHWLEKGQIRRGN